MIRRLIKVCGVTREHEIERLEQLGVDFFGLQVGLPSNWALSKSRAAELAAVAPPEPLPVAATLGWDPAAAPRGTSPATARRTG